MRRTYDHIGNQQALSLLRAHRKYHGDAAHQRAVREALKALRTKSAEPKDIVRVLDIE